MSNWPFLSPLLQSGRVLDLAPHDYVMCVEGRDKCVVWDCNCSYVPLSFWGQSLQQKLINTEVNTSSRNI